MFGGHSTTTYNIQNNNDNNKYKKICIEEKVVQRFELFLRSPKRLATHKSHRKVYYENDEQTDGRTTN